jgi:hypothetical protein
MANPYRENLSLSNAALPCTIVMAVCAWVLSLVGNFNCDFISIDTTVEDRQYSLGFGMWLYQGWTYLADSGTVYYQQTCFRYPEDLNADAKWKTAQAFSIVTAVIGAVVMILNCCALLGSPNPSKGFSIFAVAYLFCCLSQGLTLLFLQSDACQANPIFEAEQVPADATSECNMAWGAKSSIAATVLWFLAACMECCVGITYKDTDDEGPAITEPKEAEEPKEGPMVEEGNQE